MITLSLRPAKPDETPGAVIPDDARPQPLEMENNMIVLALAVIAGILIGKKMRG